MTDDTINGFKMIRNGTHQQENLLDEIFMSLKKLESFIENRTIYSKTKQVKITDFLL